MLEDARCLFDMLVTKDVVTRLQDMLSIDLVKMLSPPMTTMKQTKLVVANAFSVACLLKACAAAGALQRGKLPHSQIVDAGAAADLDVASSLVEMYAKCGKLEESCRVFHSLPSKEVAT